MPQIVAKMKTLLVFFLTLNAEIWKSREIAEHLDVKIEILSNTEPSTSQYLFKVGFRNSEHYVPI